ncbi:MAG TPA: ParB/RepB/Spo0J family partition protein, partial [Longimicrobiales bacterium]|nr:ParB/RepB/Spo0J family partition protein [Longimicrobiales bacterium]
LVENLQREALGPLEEAEGYQALSDRFDLTQEEIAEAVGKSRSSVANMLRLLKLPPSVRKHLEAGTLTMGHARALVTVPDPVRAGELARRAVAQGWSVRQMEERARRSSSEPSREEGSDGEPRGAPRTRKDPVLRALEAELQEVLATRVRVRTGTGEKGTIEIPYHSSEDLERLFALLAGREASEVVG